jgi:hypothetical protein
MLGCISPRSTLSVFMADELLYLYSGKPPLFPTHIPLAA